MGRSRRNIDPLSGSAGAINGAKIAASTIGEHDRECDHGDGISRKPDATFAQ